MIQLHIPVLPQQAQGIVRDGLCDEDSGLHDNLPSQVVPQNGYQIDGQVASAALPLNGPDGPAHRDRVESCQGQQTGDDGYRMHRVGIVGLGLLGTAVASRLLKGHVEVAGYDVRPEQAKALAAAGLRVAESTAAVCEGAEAVFTILPSLDSVDDVLCSPGGVLEYAPKDAVIIQMSTVSPELARRMGKAAGTRGYGFLDAPISGTSAMVTTGDCTLLVGGDPAHVETCRPLFDAIARRTVHVGEVGAASLAKLATNLLVALNTAAVAEALVLGAKGGLDKRKLLDAWEGSAASSRMMEVRGQFMAEGRYPPQMKLDLFMKDLHLMLDEGRRLNVPLPLTKVAERLYAAAADAGLGSEDLASVMTTLEGKATPSS